MSTIISIDGSSRRNGKPDCLAAGAVFVKAAELGIFVTDEKPSTNQRGEIGALMLGLTVASMELKNNPDQTIYIVTDSEYIFNTINKEWYKNWAAKGWVTADGDPVKNKDLWERAVTLLDKVHAYGDEALVVYHTKGHLVSVGEATAKSFLNKGDALPQLHDLVSKKFDEQFQALNKKDKWEAAKELFIRNNGGMPPADVYKEMVVCNTIADVTAGWHADRADSDTQ
jgi:ribonuclease HI